MRARSILVVLLAGFVSGCFSARYLAQAANGERHLLFAARPIAKVTRDPKTPARIRDLLARIPAIKAFARANGLTATKNYVKYADLRRPAAVWVVEACAPLAFSPKRWHFPIVGSVPYLGFFHEKDARAYAASLASKEGLDVDVRTASAYSTLGWFKDPVLSTMLGDGDDAAGELANVVLHESVHATIYVKDQSAFDESLASFVADRMTPMWLDSAFGPSSDEKTSWLDLQERYEARVKRFHEAYDALDAVYRSSMSDDEKRAAKAAVLAKLQSDTGARGTINNATLMDYRTYDTGAPAFAKLYDACGGDWGKFVGALRSLKPSDFPRAQAEEFGPVVDALTPRCAR